AAARRRSRLTSLRASANGDALAVVEPAGVEMIAIAAQWGTLHADVHAVLAPRGERAATGHVEGGDGVARNGHEALVLHPGARHGAEQSPRVGMARGAHDVELGPDL